MNIVILIFKIILFSAPILLLLGISLNIDFSLVIQELQEIFILIKELFFNIFNYISLYPNLFEIIIIIITLSVIIGLINILID